MTKAEFDDMEGTSLPEALSGEAKAALKDVTAKASKVADDVKTAVSKAVDRIKEHLEGYQLGKGWFGREQPLLTIPPLSSFVLGWTALVGGAAGFSLPQTRPALEKLVGDAATADLVRKGFMGGAFAFLVQYYRKEGQFMGPVVLDRELPWWLTSGLKFVGILALSHAAFRHATLNDTLNSKAGTDAEVGFKKIAKRPALFGASLYGLGQFLQDRTKGSFLFWGVGALVADVVGALADVREGGAVTDSIPFKAIAEGKASIVDAVKEMNPIAAITGLLVSVRYAFPETYQDIKNLFHR